jgi:translation initiation factor 6 (eIF-6)
VEWGEVQTPREGSTMTRRPNKQLEQGSRTGLLLPKESKTNELNKVIKKQRRELRVEILSESLSKNPFPLTNV